MGKKGDELRKKKEEKQKEMMEKGIIKDAYVYYIDKPYVPKRIRQVDHFKEARQEINTNLKELYKELRFDNDDINKK